MDMKIVLLEKNKLGDLGDVAHVKPGYARNYLVPHGKACYATPENIKRFEERREKLLLVEQQKLEHAEQQKDKLDGLIITVSARVSHDNKLFGSVTSADIVRSIKDACELEIERKGIINMPSGAIRDLGEYPVTVQLHPEIKAQVIVKVVSKAE